MYTSIPFVDRTSAPEPRNSVDCAEIIPHLLDKCTGDDHCGFRSLSKSITGTEANHGAFRASVVAIMRSSCAGCRRSWLVNTKSIDDYVQQTKMDTTGWLTNVELLFIAFLVQIWNCVFCDYEFEKTDKEVDCIKACIYIKGVHGSHSRLSHLSVPQQSQKPL